jgi:hypothetical protein
MVLIHPRSPFFRVLVMIVLSCVTVVVIDSLPYWAQITSYALWCTTAMFAALLAAVCFQADKPHGNRR